MNDVKVNVNLVGEVVWGIVFLFFMFWLHSGWYRVDCSLGIQKACDFIASEEEYQKPVEVAK